MMEISLFARDPLKDLKFSVLFTKIVTKVILFLILLIPLSCEDSKLRNYRLEEEYSSLFAVDNNSFKIEPQKVLIIQDGFNLPLGARNRRALDLYIDGEKDMAFHYLAESEKANPNYFGTYFSRANVFVHQKEWSKALEDYDTLISLVPGISRFHYNRGRILLALKKKEEALDDFLKALSLDAFLSEAALRTGDIYFEDRKFDKARDYYNRAISSMDIPPAPLEAYHLVYGRYNWGKKGYKAKIQAEKDLYERYQGALVYIRRGRTFLEERDYENSVKDFSLALELNETGKWAWFYRAIAYNKLKKWDKALKDLKECEFYFPEEPSVSALEAEAFYFLGDEVQARTYLDKLNAQFPSYIKDRGRDLHEKSFRDKFFYSAVSPLKLFLIGDSMAGGALRISMNTKAENYESIKFSWHYKVSSGLSNVGFYDWQSIIEGLLKEDMYDLIVVIMGTNDGQSFTYNKVRKKFRTSGWREIYKQRAVKFLNTIADHAVKIYWIGMPPMNDDYFQGKMVYLNEVFKEVCSIREDVEFIDTYPILGGKDQIFQKYVTQDGVAQLARFGDDIHFRVVGIQPLTDYLFSKLENDFYIPQ